MRVILVPVADRPECVHALNTAFSLARQLGSNVVGCHIRPHAYSEVALPAGLDAYAEYDVAWEAVWSGKKASPGSAEAKVLYARMAEDNGFSMIAKPRREAGAVWMEKAGSPDRILAIEGPVSDLVVVSRPAQGGGTVARVVLMAALLNSSKPVLVLPHSRPSVTGKRIAIAWNQSPEAARAVTAALPLLQLAEQVSIITSGRETKPGPKSSQLANYLRFWGIDSKRVTVRKAHDAQSILDGYRSSKSDLLVMGAYSTSRLRQRMFGGVTQFMLQHADIPVFMLHT
ncbi:universal stress protein [Emcibacter sp. SYSU 3D8]|uniref:universal stress protein n=1 Tax=Emcibacter sp. SYSU 3D8 TaxID=3133969 RepID=UPI0031FF1B25